MPDKIKVGVSRQMFIKVPPPKLNFTEIRLVETTLIKSWTDGLADMTKLTDAFRCYTTSPQNRCILTVQSKVKLICSGLILRKWQALDCENLKRILTGRKYNCSDTGCCTADVGGPTLLSAATCRTVPKLSYHTS